MAIRAVIYERNEKKIFAAQVKIREQMQRDLSISEVLNIFLDNIEAFELSNLAIITLRNDPQFQGEPPKRPKRTVIKKTSNFATSWNK